MGSALVNVAEERPDVAPRSVASDRGSRGATAISLGLRLLGIGPLLILILLAAAISLLTPDFLKPGNLGNIVAQRR
jgi:ribose transport system permease protein